MKTFKIDYENLPVYSQKESIIAALETHQVIVVESNTGSGKTTQLPVILYEAGYISNNKMIGMTQPRRIAAFSIAEIMGEQLCFQYPALPNDFVQYKIRFDDKTTPHTQIKIMTDGILLQEIKHDSLLSAYSVLIIDEAHERSLNIDFILGLLKNILAQRKDLKLIISSATINATVFSDYFVTLGKCSVISIEAPMFPVEIRYAPAPSSQPNKNQNRHPKQRNKKPRKYIRDDDIMEEHIVHIIKQSLQKKEGDILVFLPGERNIKNCISQIAKLPHADTTLHILPLYGRLDHQTQGLVFLPTPTGKTKIILATNIAETSITIDNISVVIDSGKVKLNYFHYHRLSSMLSEQSISKASAIQRRGRAGRTKSGICYRIYKERDYKEMQEFTEEEILRTDLSEIVLRMAHLGIQDFEHFDFISPPAKNALVSAAALLKDMDALDEQQIITDTGLLMIQFPLSPPHARILVEAMQYYPDVLSKVITVLSFFTTPNPFLLPLNEELEARHMHHTFMSQDSDFFSYITLFDTYKNIAYEQRPSFCEEHYLDLKVLNEIINVHQQLSDMVAEQGVFVGEAQHKDQIMKSILKGLMHNICLQFRGNTYINRSGEKTYIHPGSMMFDTKTYPSIIVAGEVVQTSKIFARTLSWCKLQWIEDINPYLHNQLKDLLVLLSSQSYATQQKIQAKLSSHTPLFSLSQNSAFDTIAEETPSPKKTRDTSKSITLAGKTYALSLQENKKHKVLHITWAEAKNIFQHTTKDEIIRHGKLRCDISYNVHVILKHMKLANIPLMLALYNETLLFSPRISPLQSIEKLKKTEPITEVLSLIETTMHILIPYQGKQKHKRHQTENEYKFLSLEINNSNEIYVLPERNFIKALQDSIHTLGIINDIANETHIMLPKKIRQSIHHKYTLLRQAYEKNIFESES